MFTKEVATWQDQGQEGGREEGAPGNEARGSREVASQECEDFSTASLGGFGANVWIATRERTIDQEGMPVSFGGPFRHAEEVNSPHHDRAPHVTADELRLYFDRFSPGGHTDLWVATRDRIENESGDWVPFGPPEPLTEINSAVGDSFPCPSADGRMIFFASEREGVGNMDIWMATREGTEDERGNRLPFSPPQPLTEINSASWDSTPVSRDGLTLFFTSFRGGSGDIYMATRLGFVDKNGDRIPFNTPVRLESPVINKHLEDFIGDISWDWPGCRSQFFVGRGPDTARHGYLIHWHPDCNANLVDDCDEIDNGNSLDLNSNQKPDECETMFRRGDSNDDGTVDMSDAVRILGWLFLGEPAPRCVAATNTNGDAGADLADAVYLLAHLFLGGPTPARPFPHCGPGW